MSAIVNRHISLMICSKNRRRQLEELISRLKGMDTQYNYEIVVVEETGFPAPLEDVKYVPHPVANRGIPFARNLALSHAKGEIIVFIDDDCMISENWLNKLIEPFEDNSILGVQGGVTPPKKTNSIGWAESILGFPGGGIKRIIEAMGNSRATKEISTLNCAYRKSIIDKIGGFDEKLKFGGEDYIFAKQVSTYGKCLFVPSATVNHESRGNLRKIWSWFVRRGQAEITVIQSRKYKKANYKSIVRGSLGIKFALMVLCGILISDFITYLFGITVLFYGIVIYTRYYKIWEKGHVAFAAFMILPLVKSTMDLAKDWGRLKALILPSLAD